MSPTYTRVPGTAAAKNDPASARATARATTDQANVESMVATAPAAKVRRRVRTSPMRSDRMPQTGCMRPYVRK